jgi:uncharacterized protein YbcI
MLNCKSNHPSFSFENWFNGILIASHAAPTNSPRGNAFSPESTDPMCDLDAFMPLLRTQGEVEAAVCDGISHFEQEYMGRGPKDVHAHLIGDLLVVRLRGVLTSAEQHLVKTLPAEKGRDLLKQVRTHLVETARPVLEAMIHQICGVKALSLHHDISTATGEEMLVFTLTEAPAVRELKGRHGISRIAAT